MTDDDRELLRFEEQWWSAHPGKKAEAIRRDFDISVARYYQRLGRVIAEPEALAEFPQIVHRVRTRREEAAARRAARTPGN